MEIMKADVDVSGDMELTDLDRELVAELRCGARTQGYLIDATGESRYKVHDRLRLLAAAGYLNNIHEPTALYELIEDPEHDDPSATEGDTP